MRAAAPLPAPGGCWQSARSAGYRRGVSGIAAGGPGTAGAGHWRWWLRLAAGWLVLAATIWFVPKPRRAGGGRSGWKLVAWLILFFLAAALVAIAWKSGPGPLVVVPR